MLFVDLLYRIALKELAFLLGDSYIVLTMDVSSSLLCVWMCGPVSLGARMFVCVSVCLYIYIYIYKMICFHDIPFRVFISFEYCLLKNHY